MPEYGLYLPDEYGNPEFIGKEFDVSQPYPATITRKIYKSFVKNYTEWEICLGVYFKKEDARKQCLAFNDDSLINYDPNKVLVSVAYLKEELVELVKREKL